MSQTQEQFISIENQVAAVSDALVKLKCKPRQRTIDGATVATCPVCGRAGALVVTKHGDGSTLTWSCGCFPASVTGALGYRAARQQTAEHAPPTNQSGSENHGRADQALAAQLVALGKELELFHDGHGNPYGMRRIGSGQRAAALNGSEFRTWLRGEFYRRTRRAPTAEQLATAIGVLVAEALEGASYEVSIRVASWDGCIYLDLANDNGEAVAIDAKGWRVTAQLPVEVRFRRDRSMESLPHPTLGGRLDALRGLVNIGNDAEWRLLVAWLIAGLRPGAPFPVLVLQGEQGSAKTTVARVLRRLLDPSKPLDRARPRDDRDLMIAARNGWVLSFDNLSGLPDWLSDALCRISTGAGYATRRLHTDADEEIFEACRPVILNGIDELLTRPDLADRALRVTLPVIPESARRSAAEVELRFRELWPGVLGSMCTAASGALSHVESVRGRRVPLPRMADFAEWGIAIEIALGWPEGAFLDSYRGNRGALVAETLDNDPVAAAVVRYVDPERGWEGTAAELLKSLPPGDGGPTLWPRSARGLSDRLRRISPMLRAAGWRIEAPGIVRHGHDRRRIWRIDAPQSTDRSARTPATDAAGAVGTSQRNEAAQ